MKKITKKKESCPTCGLNCKRHSKGTRSVIGLSGKTLYEYGKYYCPTCRKHFSQQVPGVGFACRYSDELKEFVFKKRQLGVVLWIIRQQIWRENGIYIAESTLHDLGEAYEKSLGYARWREKAKSGNLH